MSQRKWFFFFIFILVSILLYGQEKEDNTLLLKIGDEDLKDKVMTVSPGKLYSSQRGAEISYSRMITEMRTSRFVYVGESHNSLPMHDIQFKIVQALYEQDKNLSIGLEMLPVTLQEVLNKWSLGILCKDEFIQEAKWYVTWNLNFGFYEKIFNFAKENGISLYALNVPRELITQVRKQGWESLSEEEKKIAPRPDLSHEEHKTLIRTIFQIADIPHQMKGQGLDMMFEGLYRAQSAWDESMAFHAYQSYKKDNKRMVVLAGSGHLLYNLGINRRAYERSKLPFKTVVCVEVPKGEESIQVSRSLADYVWGLEEEDSPVFPSVGLKFKKFDGLDNLVIESVPIDGVAKGKDFEKGDVVLSVDGHIFFEINELRIYLARFKWDDEVKFRLLREANEKEVILKFRQAEE